MKSKLKALVAAVALAAVAGQASANIQVSAIGTPGELVFFAYGKDAGGAIASYAKDLGITYDAFLANPTFAVTNLGTDANWNAFNGNAALVGDKFWGVFATQNNSGTGLNNRKILTTFTNDTFAPGAVTNAIMVAAHANIQTTSTAINNFDGTPNSTNNSYYFDLTTSGLDRNIGWKLQDTLGTTTFSPAVNVVGGVTNANFFEVRRQSNIGNSNAFVNDIDAASAYWTLAGNDLSYNVAAIPEPETYGMLAAGLLMLGAVARRRRQQ